MFVKMQEDIEEVLNKYFPKKWARDDIGFFINNSSYTLDVGAINKNLNIPLRDFVLRGGKRIRPVLFLSCLKLFGKDYKKYLGLAILIELVHNATLILDDIEDDGKFRRGKPTCHIKFGIDTAVNAGFSLHMLPLKILLNGVNQLTDKQKLHILQIYIEELINVGFGQSLDIFWHKNPSTNISINKYLEMVRLKTGSLMRMSLRMACVVANRSSRDEELFKNFGERIGMAFQIRDDALDLSPRNGKFGKSYGNDISEGKISMPVVLALKNLNNSQKEELVKLLSKHTSSKGLIRKATEMIERTGALEESMIYAENLVNEAWEKLEKGWKNGEELEDLRKLTYFFVKRDY